MILPPSLLGAIPPGESFRAGGMCLVRRAMARTDAHEPNRSMRGLNDVYRRARPQGRSHPGEVSLDRGHRPVFARWRPNSGPWLARATTFARDQGGAPDIIPRRRSALKMRFTERTRQYFLAPQQTTQRRYEALRALFVTGEPLAVVAQRFGYKISALK